MTILVAVSDAGGAWESVLEVAVTLGKGLEQELYVVHLTDQERATAEDRRVRDDIRDALEGRGVAFEVGIEYVDYVGRPGKSVGRQLVELTADTEVTHVVVGHRSKRLVERLREGSAAFEVADGASVPVTIVPEGPTAA